MHCFLRIRAFHINIAIPRDGAAHFTGSIVCTRKRLSAGKAKRIVSRRMAHRARPPSAPAPCWALPRQDKVTIRVGYRPFRRPAVLRRGSRRLFQGRAGCTFEPAPPAAPSRSWRQCFPAAPTGTAPTDRIPIPCDWRSSPKVGPPAVHHEPEQHQYVLEEFITPGEERNQSLVKSC